MVALNQPVPNFELQATGDLIHTWSDLKGSPVVLYFYPRDNTPGCTNEGKDFAELYPLFEKKHTKILGISRDSISSHHKFKEKYQFPFELISDTNETICKLFDVIKLKKNYGKEYLGIERSTFLVDQKGILRKEWRKVKVSGHAQNVLETVQLLLED